MEENKVYIKSFIPYAFAAFLIGIVGGFSTMLGPAFVNDIGISYNNTTWTALAQATSTAACAPILGKLGDVLGRRKTLLAGVLIFTLGNVLTAIASSLLFMMGARFIVGVGSAAVNPIIMAYIVSEFPQDQVAKGFSWYMLISSIAVVFGPAISGVIVEAYGWRTMIWICVVICALVFPICLTARDKSGNDKKTLEDFDGAGAVLVLLFFSLVLCIPSFGQNFGWTSNLFLGVLVATLISLVGLVLVEKKAKYPILPGGFIRRNAFVLSVLALFLTQGLMQANMTNTIVFVNYTQPQNKIVSSYAISVMYLGMSVGSLFLGPLADKFEPKYILIGSHILTGIGCAIFLAFSANTSVLLLMLSLGILGVGLGGNGTIFMKVALSGLSAQEAGAGTGTYGLFRDLSAPFGVAVFVPMFTNRIVSRIEMGENPALAAVDSIRNLSVIEISCVIVGIAVVSMLPKIHVKKKTSV